MEKTFSLFDIDGSGDISIPELTAVLQSLGKEFSDEDLKEMHDIADKNGTTKTLNLCHTAATGSKLTYSRPQDLSMCTNHQLSFTPSIRTEKRILQYF